MSTGNRTMFGDLRTRAAAVYRVTTQSSVYVVALHTDGGKRHVVVRGQGPDPVVLRDTEPKVGGAPLFDVPPNEWIGKLLEVATMRSTAIVSVVGETDPVALAAVGGIVEARSPWARPAVPTPTPPAGTHTVVDPPPGVMAAGHMPESPCIVPLPVKGTLPFDQVMAAGLAPQAKELVVGRPVVPAAPAAAAAVPELPYPMRHLHYAESMVQLLRSISRRERVFEDLAAASPAYRERLRAALDDCALLLETIRRRDR